MVRTRLRGRMIGLVALAHDIEYRLSPLEDRRSDCLLHDLFRLSAPPAIIATQPTEVPDRSIPAPEVASITTAPIASYTDSLGEWHDYVGDFWDHNLRIVQEDNRYIMIGTLTGGDPFRLELTELSPEVGVVRQLVA